MVLIILLVLLAFYASAQEEYHLKLLAVQGEDNFVGSDADLYLELRKGDGRVFLDTFPLTKIDTQISTRFSKEITCKHFDLDCDDHDFIYTINAKSSIIGGPSAGAAIAALTTIAVKDLDYNQSISITATINSGGILGPVGGVKEKLEAASGAGLKKVIIAKGSAILSTGDNETFNLTKYAVENLSLQLVELQNIDEVVLELTGVELNHKEVDITISPQYNLIMESLHDVLCQRSSQLMLRVENKSESIIRREGLSANASAKGDFYSAASFCFGNNIQLKREIFVNLSENEIIAAFLSLGVKTSNLQKKLSEQEIGTISDLQTMMIVKERVNDVEEYLKLYETNVSMQEGRNILAYAEERFFSALSWMQFFAMEGNELLIDDEKLKNSCMQKISESEQRHQYVNIYVPSATHIVEKIDRAKTALENQDYLLCLDLAAQAKGEANTILSSLGLQHDSLDDFLHSKRKAVERVIAENSAEGTFPILGYSYYQYAQSLDDKFTSLLYYEYALEMSELSIYFPEEKKRFVSLPDDDFVLFFQGFILGVAVVIFIYQLRRRK